MSGAEAARQDTVIYLLPGLTAGAAAGCPAPGPQQRPHGPRPAAARARRLAAPWPPTGSGRRSRNGAAAMRGHPVLFLPPLIVVVLSARSPTSCWCRRVTIRRCRRPTGPARCRALRHRRGGAPPPAAPTPGRAAAARHRGARRRSQRPGTAPVIRRPARPGHRPRRPRRRPSSPAPSRPAPGAAPSPSPHAIAVPGGRASSSARSACACHASANRRSRRGGMPGAAAAARLAARAFKTRLGSILTVHDASEPDPAAGPWRRSEPTEGDQR